MISGPVESLACNHTVSDNLISSNSFGTFGMLGGEMEIWGSDSVVDNEVLWEGGKEGRGREEEVPVEDVY